MSRFAIDNRLGRFAAYGLLGWCAEVAFTGVTGFARDRDWRLPAYTSLWMLPTYGLVQPLFEPVRDALEARGAPAPLRAAAYGLGFLGVEYSTGRLMRALIGDASWDYSYARLHVHGLIRPDYFPIWAAAGMALERVDDHLRRRTRAIH